MKLHSMGWIAAACMGMAGLACGGGSDGGRCADLASTVKACITSLGGTVDGMPIQAECDALTCTGSKDAAIDCVTGLECTEDMETQAAACVAAQDCHFPATCTGFAYLANMCDGADIAAMQAMCDSVTCTGSRTAALECLVALDCSASSDDLTACLAAEGCTTPAPALRW